MDQHLIIEDEKKDRGFTLVELLIVIVILGILATVTVFAVRGITDKGQDNACSVEQRTLETAIEAYYAKNGTNPAGFAALVPEFVKTAPDAAKFTFVPGTATTSASVTPIGVCA